MNTEFFTTARIAGILLLLSLVLILGAAGVIAAQGRLAGLAAGFRGVGPETRDASMARAAIPYTMAQLAGFALFALLPAWAGRAALAWSLVSFPLYFLVFGAPLIAVVTPLLLGIGLLVRG